MTSFQTIHHTGNQNYSLLTMLWI